MDRELIDSFRRWGYLQAELDPLGRLKPEAHPELQGDPNSVAELRRIYCGSIGVEFMHIPDTERRAWIASRMESNWAKAPKERTLDALVRTDILEQLLQTRYLGNKRFSIKGLDGVIPLLQTVLEKAGDYETKQVILAMSHRGRLNVLTNIVGRPAAEVFIGFEDVDPKSTLGGGDVKYHQGATGSFETSKGYRIPVHLVSNPSHLEAVDPVALGRAKAYQVRLGSSQGQKILPILLHGDAAFAGQGIVAEVLNLADLEGFSVNGTIHIIVNNLIGFTAVPHELHSSRFASDVAKRLPIPIVHVNGEDQDAVAHAAQLVTDYRYHFSSDIVLDFIGYRLYGHSEIDDPTITQPLLYKRVQSQRPLWQSFAESAGIDSKQVEENVADVRAELEAAITKAKAAQKRPVMRDLPDYWQPFFGGRYRSEFEVDTGLQRGQISDLAAKLTRFPSSFNVHPKVAKLLEARAEMGRGERPFDYGMAESLAFASILESGRLVRLSGQDCKRGTFNHRHSFLVDVETGEEFVPLKNLAAGQGEFLCYDSVLSEAAVLGFEYGFSRDFPEGLVMWEAQFGDFANGAQVIIDQFISAGEDKWELLSGLTVLLPHGHEGQGPEHSSARIERFLQLAARDNMQVAQPSTAGQYFHLLRRQVFRDWRKPLIVFTPKSMLRHPDALSPIEEFEQRRFLCVKGDPVVQDADRVLLCSGKIAHELRREREKRSDTGTAVVTIEQIYPFPEEELRVELRKHPRAHEIVWVQEEPGNMGCLSFVQPRIQRLAPGYLFRSVKRSSTATPATGSAKAHQVEQKTLLALAFARVG